MAEAKTKLVSLLSLTAMLRAMRRDWLSRCVESCDDHDMDGLRENVEGIVLTGAASCERSRRWHALAESLAREQAGDVIVDVFSSVAPLESSGQAVLHSGRLPHSRQGCLRQQPVLNQLLHVASDGTLRFGVHESLLAAGEQGCHHGGCGLPPR